MNVPFVSFVPLEKEIEQNIKSAFERVYSRSWYIKGVVLDSRWFTTICRDEGFLVSGHFRLQPCKDEQGEWTRKLIYINPYAKHGYHRLAPIVNLEKEDGE